MAFTPYCAQCQQPIVGKVLTYERANCCESCLTRIDAARAGEELDAMAQRASVRQASARDAAAKRASDELAEKRLRQINAGPQPQRRQYKVLTARDGFFSGRFDPNKLDDAINHFAQQGWVVTSMATAALPGGLAGNRDELIVLFEREYVREHD
ncbi:MAG TPA: DUF4177 domain-containing protein [Gemmatimonadaceae bacterium]|jgi:hypothetical protein